MQPTTKNVEYVPTTQVSKTYPMLVVFKGRQRTKVKMFYSADEFPVGMAFTVVKKNATNEDLVMASAVVASI